MRPNLFRRAHDHQRSRGQALAEFAIVVPVFLLLVGGIIQFGIIFWGQNSLNQIVRDAGRYAVTEKDCSGTSNTDIVNKIRSLASGSTIATLAIDVSNAYSARQGYRTAADAAALAGAQDLQSTNSRSVSGTQYTNAMADAKASLDQQFGATSTCATTSASRKDCTFPALPYKFAIITPLPSGACVDCDITRSVQVNFANPTFQLSFAHLIGIGSYRVASTSVAG